MRVDTRDFQAGAPQALPVRAPPVDAGSPSAADPRPATPPADPAVTVQQAAERIQQYLRESRRELSFAVDGESGRVVVTVTDPNTGELVRQIPSEEALRIARHLSSALVDLLA